MDSDNTHFPHSLFYCTQPLPKSRFCSVNFDNSYNCDFSSPSIGLFLCWQSCLLCNAFSSMKEIISWNDSNGARKNKSFAKHFGTYCSEVWPICLLGQDIQKNRKTIGSKSLKLYSNLNYCVMIIANNVRLVSYMSIKMKIIIKISFGNCDINSEIFEMIELFDHFVSFV